ncbi:MAG: polyprenyl synthetase family protein [Anaerolineaceae bacterium]|nr:polyprenyl synthetase family protein [Anaerolineaceae bacterium]
MKKHITDDINQTIYQYLLNNAILKQDVSLQEMLFYALGFRADGTLLESGKRLRPLFCCLSCGVVSGSYAAGLLYGAALEMLHNYTLVHDDIEDNSDTRHNRPSLWKRNGVSLAINAGDLLYEIALSAAAKADELSGKNGLKRMMKMSEELFLGQHRDISFEKRTDIDEAEYLQMVSGKTSALLGCSFALGAMAGGGDEKTISDFEAAGKALGIAFQIRDDYLGTWGNSEKLGKSVSADIMDKKNTLAVVFTMGKDPNFKEKWLLYDGGEERVPDFAQMMEKAGAPEYLDELCKKYTRETKTILSPYHQDNVYQQILDEIIDSLVERKK